MKKTYISGFAFTLAVTSAPSFALAQYNGQYNQPLYGGQSFAPSNYGAPSSPYQLVGTQGDQLIPQAMQHNHVPLPGSNAPAAPQQVYQDLAPQPIPQSMPQPMAMSQPMSYPQPMVQQGAPGCSSCNTGSGVISYDAGFGGAGSCASGNCGTPGMGSYGPFSGGLGNRWQMGQGGGCGVGGCGPASPTWFGGAGGLYFATKDSRYVSVANVAGMPILGTQEARVGAGAGVSGFVGKYFNCGKNAIVGDYWGVFPDANQSIATDVGLRSSLNFGQPQVLGTPGVEYNTGAGIVDVYDIYNHDLVTAVTAQRVRRDNEVNSGEINILGFGLGGAAIAPSCGSCGGGSYFGGPSAGLMPASCSRLRMGWLVGVRWLRFRDNFEYATSQTDDDFGTTNDDMYYTNRVVNNLVGAQMGGFLNYCLTQRVSLYTGTKFGLMGNHMKHDTRLGTTNTAATINSPNAAYNGQAYDFMSSRDGVSFLGEGDVGMNVRIKCGWSANVGYRAIGVSGIANSVGQIPYKFDDISQIRHVNNSDALLLHGVYFGGSYNF